MKRHGNNETKWEPVENLFDMMDLVSEFMTKKQQQSKGNSCLLILWMNLLPGSVVWNTLSLLLLSIIIIVLDQIIGCGEHRGQKYFLVRFRGQDKTEMINWEAAKQYSVDVMEFFGSRAVWTDLRNIVNPDVDDDSEDDAAEETADGNVNRPSTSQIAQLDEYPNEIEFEK